MFPAFILNPVISVFHMKSKYCMTQNVDKQKLVGVVIGNKLSFNAMYHYRCYVCKLGYIVIVNHIIVEPTLCNSLHSLVLMKCSLHSY